MIPVYKPYFSGKEKEYVNNCLDSTWISSKGEYISKFEKAFADFIKIDHATTVSNGTVALHLALEALKIKAGDEVIVPTFTYIASVNTILQTGAKPIYVDSLATTWNIDPQEILRKITNKTKAIMIVHLYGLSCDMDSIVKICKDHNLFLIEDCAEAFGSYYKGQHVGTFGDVSTFSFFGNKTITTGEGGMVVMNGKAIFDRAYHLKNQGVSSEREYWHDIVAYNYRMTNICAAIGLAQLENAPEILQKKKQIAAHYQTKLAHLPLEFHLETNETTHSYWMCSILTKNKEARQPLRDYLKANGIETRPVFFPAHTMPHSFTDEKFPIAEDIASRGLNLPSYPDLSQDDLNHITSTIENYFK
jgi:perosamine synthetase